MPSSFWFPSNSFEFTDVKKEKISSFQYIYRVNVCCNKNSVASSVASSNISDREMFNIICWCRMPCLGGLNNNGKWQSNQCIYVQNTADCIDWTYWRVWLVSVRINFACEASDRCWINKWQWSKRKSKKTSKLISVLANDVLTIWVLSLKQWRKITITYYYYYLLVFECTKIIFRQIFRYIAIATISGRRNKMLTKQETTFWEIERHGVLVSSDLNCTTRILHYYYLTY